MTVPFAVFASGSGSNVEALLHHEGHGAGYRIDVLIVDRRCGAQDRVRAHGRQVHRLNFGHASAGAQVLKLLRRRAVQGILLAGFLRLLPDTLCRAYRGRVLNIHPALLPLFGGQGMYGRRVHEAVLASGAKVSGPTVHLVNERYDEGAIVAQWPVPVLPGDSVSTLAARVLEAEHVLYPAAASALAGQIANWDGFRECPRPAFRWPGIGCRDAGVLRGSVRRAFGDQE